MGGKKIYTLCFIHALQRVGKYFRITEDRYTPIDKGLFEEGPHLW
jgi:hypothetical protein